MKKRNTGITLIALVITIIVLLILAGIVISLTIGENGMINKAKESGLIYDEQQAKEKLELVLLDMQAEKVTNSEYNQEEYLTKKIEENDMTVNGDIVFVNGWKFEIDRNIPEVSVSLGKVQENEPIFTAVANAPDIKGFNKDITYYVAWDLMSSPYNIDEKVTINGVPPSNWYDYTAGTNQWANIKTTGSGNDCYWVWIPRYAYQIPTANTDVPETINVKFLRNDTNIPIGEKTAITNTTPTVGEWVVHPAFTNAGNGGFGELTGIWVAKYEASSSSVSVATLETDLKTNGGGDVNTLQVRSIPNVTSWRGITVNNMFTVCRNITTSQNSVAGSSDIDSHMMKNTEWGACAYLSMSIYGKNSRVWNNSFYNNTTNYSPITGLGGPDETTPKIDRAVMNEYNTTGGKEASTTGNVYGIYDMAGGAWEQVAGYLNEITPLADYTTLAGANSKYKDNYVGIDVDRTINYNANTNKYGDAVWETSLSGDSDTGSWNGMFANFPNSATPVFGRGGHASNGSNTGIFAFRFGTGVAADYGGFRPVLVSLKL